VEDRLGELAVAAVVGRSLVRRRCWPGLPLLLGTEQWADGSAAVGAVAAVFLRLAGVQEAREPALSRSRVVVPLAEVEEAEVDLFLS